MATNLVVLQNKSACFSLSSIYRAYQEVLRNCPADDYQSTYAYYTGTFLSDRHVYTPENTSQPEVSMSCCKVNGVDFFTYVFLPKSQTQKSRYHF